MDAALHSNAATLTSASGSQIAFDTSVHINLDRCSDPRVFAASLSVELSLASARQLPYGFGSGRPAVGRRSRCRPRQIVCRFQHAIPSSCPAGFRDREGRRGAQDLTSFGECFADNSGSKSGHRRGNTLLQPLQRIHSDSDCTSLRTVYVHNQQNDSAYNERK